MLPDTEGQSKLVLTRSSPRPEASQRVPSTPLSYTQLRDILKPRTIIRREMPARSRVNAVVTADVELSEITGREAMNNLSMHGKTDHNEECVS
jgi:hypothetical protein